MGIIKSLTDTDLYKITMMQMAYHQYPDAVVTYEFICRNKGVDLSPFKDEIQKEVDKVGNLKFTDEEINYLDRMKKNKKLFKTDFLNFLKKFKLNKNEVKVYVEGGTLKIKIHGKWVDTILWEVPLLSIVNEVYFRNTQPNADKKIAMEKLLAKVAMVEETNEGKEDKFLFSEFGTRRRFSRDWQLEVCKVLKEKLLNKGFVGTSNVHIAMQLGLEPIGTFAHEAFSAHQVLANKKGEDSYLISQEETLKAWVREYGEDLSIALSDIYGTDAFLQKFSKELSEHFAGLRHDSGDPIVWVTKVVEHYVRLGIDSTKKMMVFSDGLNFPKAIEIFEKTKGLVKRMFGIGTNLTNDFGFPALNIVIKMVACNGMPVVKISDEPTKAIGDRRVIDKVQNYFEHLSKGVRRKDVINEAHARLGADSVIKNWLSQKNPALNGERPKDILDKDPARVMEVLQRADHGRSVL